MISRASQYLAPVSRRIVSRRCKHALPEASEDNTAPARESRVLAEPLKKPEGMVRAPYYRHPFPQQESPNMVHDEFMNEGDATGTGVRLVDYYKMGDYVRGLKTAAERIEFVNPYEREWTRFERKWHRRFHPDLMKPRKAWNIPVVPSYFDSLRFYQYITKTRLIEDYKMLHSYYHSLVPPTAKFERRLLESLKAIFDGKPPKSEADVNAFLKTTLTNAEMSLAHSVDSIQKYRMSTNERCESFWIRGGFLSMYDSLAIWDEDGVVDSNRRKKPRFPCDDRRKLGELSFVMRDSVAAQIRGQSTLPPLASFNQAEVIEAPLFSSDVDINDVVYSPTVFDLWPDPNPLWQCPGYEPDSGESFMFGRLAVKSVFELNERISRWGMTEGEEYDMTVKENMAATAVTSLFNWLNGQAHCLGHTQYNDIEEPLVSQLILSDGKTFYFAVGQLNTIAINVEMDGFLNRRSNLCVVDGPYNLYDEYDADTQTYRYENEQGELVEGLNPHVMSRYLQMLMIGRKN